MVGHVLLFHPAFQKIKDLIEDGTLGDLQYIYSNRLNLGTIRTEENVFWSFAPHDIALFQWLTGSYPEMINSSGMDILQNGIHDTTVTTLEYPKKLMGHIYVSWLHPFKEHRFVVVGSKGMIRFEDSVEGKPLVFYDKSIEWEEGKPIPKSGSTWYVEYESGMPLTRELKYFVDHLNGEPIKKSNGESAIDVMKILETATDSLTEDKDEQ
jgi:UDP-2-acetamido-3-amino-2,3-dideoxy-glucuronate N-acetyltransferase